MNKIIIQTNVKMRGFKGAIYFGKDFIFYSDEGIENTLRKAIFAELPAGYSCYQLLEKLGGNYSEQDMARLYVAIYLVDKDIAKDNVTYCESRYQKVGARLFDALSFIYENQIVIHLFSEHKTFVKATLTRSFEGDEK